MTGEVIKKFLVSLGFGVDDGQLKKFGAAIKTATSRVALMAVAVKAAAVGTFLGIAKIAEGFEEMGYQYRMIAPAINKQIILRRALTDAYKAAGINMVQAIQQSVRFNLSLAKTKFALEGIVKSTAMKFVPMLTKQMDIFRVKINANMPKILNFLERLVKFIFKAFEGVVLLGTRLWSMLGRVWGVLEKLDDVTGGWSTKVIALIAAWKLFNLAFIATPIGAIITGLVLLLALFDDFMTWAEGGDSLFDWGAWVPAINAVKETFLALWEVIKDLYEVFKNLGDALIKVVTLDFSGAFDSLLKSGDKLWSLFGNVLDTLVGIGNFQFGVVGGLVDSIGSLFGDEKPLGSTGGAAGSQNVSQTTQIVVQGASDPGATAQRVSNEQNKVNANMARNMKGATR
jgi:hypothetical protein